MGEMSMPVANANRTAVACKGLGRYFSASLGMMLLCAAIGVGGADGAPALTSAECYAIPSGTSHASIPPGVYVTSSRFERRREAGVPAHFVPLVCSRPKLMRFAADPPEGMPQRGRLEARTIAWSRWGPGRAIGSATVDTCADGCRTRGTVVLSGSLRLRVKNGWITVYTQAETINLRQPFGEEQIVLSPAPSSALEDTRIRKRDLAGIRAAVITGGSFAGRQH